MVLTEFWLDRDHNFSFTDQSIFATGLDQEQRCSDQPWSGDQLVTRIPSGGICHVHNAARPSIEIAT